MKKLLCLTFLFMLCFWSVFGFDSSLNGSWGFSDSELVKFNNNEITFSGIIYRANQIRIINENTIIVNMNDILILIQYYFLSTDNLLFIHKSGGSNSIVFILHRL